MVLADVVPDFFGCEHVLDRLVFDHTPAGFLYGFNRQLHVLVLPSFDHLVGNVVNRLLVKALHDI